MEITKGELELLKKRFNIDNHTQPDMLLKRVLTKGIEGIENDLFFKFIHFQNDYTNETANNFLNAISKSSCPYFLIHGYSKNGKSTFVEYVRYLNNTQKDKEFRIIIKTFNFEKLNQEDSYIDKLKLFLLQQINFRNKDRFSESIRDLEGFLNFYDTFIDEINAEMKESNDELVSDDSSLAIFLDRFFRHIFSGISMFISNIDLNKIGDLNAIRNNLEKKFNEHINADNCGSIIPFIILLNIFRSRNRIFQKDKKPRKLIFVLDNIDDYLKHHDILFLQLPQFQLSAFVNVLFEDEAASNIFSRCLYDKSDVSEDNESSINFAFDRDLKIAYVFRTANFFVFSHVVQEKLKKEAQSLERKYPKCLIDREYYIYRSVKFTNDIIKTRLDFFESFIEKCNIKFPEGYSFIKSLSNSFLNENDSSRGENKSIFSMWNGDKQELWKSINNNWDKVYDDFLKHEVFIQRAVDENFYSHIFLLKGLYIYFFLYLFDINISLNGFLKGIYSYKKYHKVNKNVRRFIINYVINESEKNKNPKSLRDINEKGAGLKDLLDSINSFIKQHKNLYTLNDVEHFFSEVFNEKIDFFTHMFTIYKSQLVNIKTEDGVKRVNSIYYNIETELKNYSKGVENEDLNQIRLFNNDNTLFLSTYLISHFEMYSFYLSHTEEKDRKKLEIKKPLILSLYKKHINSIDTVVSNYEFYDIIEAVYAHVKTSITNMVDFYINKLKKDYPPEKFISNPLFTVFNKTSKKGDFQFRLHITRHITYLESFRRGIVEDKLIKFSGNLKSKVNIYLVKVIEKYVRLYRANYEKIYPDDPYNDKNEYNLLTTYKKTDDYLELINKILSSEEDDYKTILQPE